MAEDGTALAYRIPAVEMRRYPALYQMRLLSRADLEAIGENTMSLNELQDAGIYPPDEL